MYTEAAFHTVNNIWMYSLKLPGGNTSIDVGGLHFG